MNGQINCKVTTVDASQTEDLARQIGKNLQGGEFIELTSDLGGGKTSFVRGLVAGSGSTDVVSSPTFNLSKVYKAPNLTIYHFDFYRLTDAGLIAHELQDVMHDHELVVVVEWSGVIGDVLPDQRMIVTIDHTNSEINRDIALSCPLSMKYLLGGVC